MRVFPVAGMGLVTYIGPSVAERLVDKVMGVVLLSYGLHFDLYGRYKSGYIHPVAQCNLPTGF